MVRDRSSHPVGPAPGSVGGYRGEHWNIAEEIRRLRDAEVNVKSGFDLYTSDPKPRERCKQCLMPLEPDVPVRRSGNPKVLGGGALHESCVETYLANNPVFSDDPSR